MKIRDDHTCPLELVHDMIKGKWKPIILWRLRLGANLKKRSERKWKPDVNWFHTRYIGDALFNYWKSSRYYLSRIIQRIDFISNAYTHYLLISAFEGKKWNGSNVCCIFMCDYNSWKRYGSTIFCMEQNCWYFIRNSDFFNCKSYSIPPTSKESMSR